MSSRPTSGLQRTPGRVSVCVSKITDPAPLSSGVVCEHNMLRKHKLWLTILVVACVAVALYLPRFIHDRNTAASRAAIHNLDEIDKAMRQSASNSQAATRPPVTNG